MTMTRNEARKIAHKMIRAGLTGVTMHENIETGEVLLTGHNGMSMKRWIANEEDWNKLVRIEGPGK